MTTEPTITVLAAASRDALDSRGADVEELHCETVAQARKRARYLLSEEYRIASECSERLGYSRVLVNGICVTDFVRY